MGVERCGYTPDPDMLKAMLRWVQNYEPARTEPKAGLPLFRTRQSSCAETEI